MRTFWVAITFKAMYRGMSHAHSYERKKSRAINSNFPMSRSSAYEMRRFLIAIDAVRIKSRLFVHISAVRNIILWQGAFLLFFSRRMQTCAQHEAHYYSRSPPHQVNPAINGSHSTVRFMQGPEEGRKKNSRQWRWWWWWLWKRKKKEKWVYT